MAGLCEEKITWKTLMSFSSPLRLISKPFNSARVPSSLKTAYRFLIRIPSSFEAGRIIACMPKFVLRMNDVTIKSSSWRVDKPTNLFKSPCRAHPLQIQLNIRCELYTFYLKNHWVSAKQKLIKGCLNTGKYCAAHYTL